MCRSHIDASFPTGDRTTPREMGVTDERFTHECLIQLFLGWARAAFASARRRHAGPTRWRKDPRGRPRLARAFPWRRFGQASMPVKVLFLLGVRTARTILGVARPRTASD